MRVTTNDISADALAELHVRDVIPIHNTLGYVIGYLVTADPCVERWRALPVSRKQAVVDAVGDLAIGSAQAVPDAIVAEACLALLGTLGAQRDERPKGEGTG